MPNAAILTPDPDDEGFQTRWREVFAQLAEPLERRGISVEGRSWTDGRDLTIFDLVLPLKVWGYHHAGQRWQEQVLAWEQAGVKLMNPGSVLRWNADKRYLGRLAARGAPVTPTLYADAITPDLLEEAVDRFGTTRLIAKPQVAASAWQTIRWSPGEPLKDGPTGAAMIQPYLPGIEEAGETSLIYFGGGFSHAIRKRPKRGDFRVQPEYGADIGAHSPLDDERAAAEAALAAVEETLLYARVDLVRDLQDRPVLMELELVEPDLYLGYDPAAADRFGDAALRALI
jgi:glutathione synthase/RimK-type ligase-like ATP-grasp enzyme